jgi:hypothetical protein
VWIYTAKYAPVLLWDGKCLRNRGKIGRRQWSGVFAVAEKSTAKKEPVQCLLAVFFSGNENKAEKSGNFKGGIKVIA